MQNPKNLKRFDVKAFAKAQGQLAGETPLVEFERLALDFCGEVSGHVAWYVQGTMAPDQSGKQAIFLRLEAKASVPLTCQRCLQAVAQELQVERDFRFVADEATAAAQDEGSDEDLLVLVDHFDLIGLIEDELLMSLPLLPMHPICLTAQVPSSADDEAGLSGATPHPFAVLASLKSAKH